MLEFAVAFELRQNLGGKDLTELNAPLVDRYDLARTALLLWADKAEGFNNKVGWLTRQDYGYPDEKYLHLKIYDLPNLSTRRDL